MITPRTSGARGAPKRSDVRLPRPSRRAGKSLLQALQQRHTTRTISTKPLSLQQLSDLLWAACGINRQHGPFKQPGSTAGSASNSQEIQVYVALPATTYLYDPEQQQLLARCGGDLRPLAIGAGQNRAGDRAPVRLIYVADIDRLRHTRGFQEPGLHDPEVQRSYYYVDTGMIAANVYLFAAARGLASWFHNCNRTALAAKLKLTATQRVLFGHTIGYATAPKR